MNGLPYRDTFAAKGSALHTAMTEAPAIIREAVVARVYKETGERYKAIYPRLDREYFDSWQTNNTLQLP